jgi:hypothetical protein
VTGEGGGVRAMQRCVATGLGGQRWGAGESEGERGSAAAGVDMRARPAQCRAARLNPILN